MRKKIYEIRKNYVKWIWQYKKRRDVMLEHQKEMTQKIKIWKRQIKRMDDRKARIIALGNAIAMFTGLNVKNSNGSVTEGMKEAKSMFYKYGLENGMIATELEDYIATEEMGQASKYRRNFNRSFEANPSKRDVYTRFKEQYERVETEEV